MKTSEKTVAEDVTNENEGWKPAYPKLTVLAGVLVTVAVFWGFWALLENHVRTLKAAASVEKAQLETVQKGLRAAHTAKMTQYLKQFEKLDAVDDLQEEDLNAVLQEFCTVAAVHRSQPVGRFVYFVELNYSLECARAVAVTRSSHMANRYQPFNQAHNCEAAQHGKLLRVVCHGYNWPNGLMPQERARTE